MADYNAGIARATLELEAAKAEQTLDRIKKSTLEYESILKRVLGLGKAGLPGVPGGSGGAKLPSVPGVGGGTGLGGAANDAAAAERATLRYATAVATAQKAQGDLHGAVDTYRAALRSLTPNTIEAQQAIARLARAEADLAKGGAGAQVAAGLKSGFLNIVGPAALAAAGIGLATRAVTSFEAAFKFKAELDQTNASITTLLKGVRDSGDVFSQARAFADKYKLTQKETSEAISESIPVIRKSRSSIEDILGVFTRLTILKPGKTFADASRAISELQAGQTVSLEKIFNVPIEKANALKHEIEGGADAIAVLSKFLTDSGVGMDALAIRTRGATGAMHDAERAQEALTLAQAKFAQGPGLFFVKTYANALNNLARASTGDEQRAAASGKLIGAVKNYQQYTQAVQAANEAAQRPQTAEEDIGKLAQLSQAQFNYAQSLIATGVSAREASDRAQELNPTLIAIGQVQAQVGKTGELSAQGLDQLANAILHTAESGPAGVAATDGLIQAYLAGGISAEEFRQALIKLKNQHQEVQAAEERAKLAAQGLADQRRGEIGGTADLAAAIDPLIAKLSEEDRAKVTSKFDGLELAAAQKQLDEDSKAAAVGMLGAGDQAELLAAKYGKTRKQALLLIDAQQQITNAGALADQRAGEHAPGASGAAEAAASEDLIAQGKFRTLAQAGIDKAAADAKREAERIAAARARLEDSQAITSAQKIALARRRLNAATNEADRLDAQADLNNLVAQQEKAKTKGASKGLSADTRADLKLLSDKQDRLNEINRLLKEGHQTELATKQLKIEQADLERQIGDEIDKQNEARVNADLDTVRDAQAKLKEAREARGLERQLQSGHFSASQQETARLRLAEIQLEQQKRALDINKETKAAGGTPLGAPTGTPLTGQAGAPLTGTPLTPGVPLGPIASLASASPINLSLTINIDEGGKATISGAPPGVSVLDVLVRTAPGGG